MKRTAFKRKPPKIKEKKLPKIKAPNPAKLKKELDRVFSLYIRARDKHICFTCGKKMEPNKSQNGHFVARHHLNLRYDTRNCNAQCYGCNIARSGNMVMYAINMRKKYGPEIIEQLEGESRVLRKIEPFEYLDMIDFYKQEITRL